MDNPIYPVERPNANLVRRLCNNSWDEPAVTREEAEKIVEKIIKDKDS